ncbi:NosD domain-containing protein [Methanosarcina sp. T3]|uniref:NosD domain-containing protein n=1 Tax=Methanosarcina sp. T3 TaxID=3439062 RepID=UPI003F83F56E
MHQTKRKGITIFIAVLTFNFLFTGNVAAVSITVNNSTVSDADFASIQAAVDAANPDDEIIVKPGIYVENIEIPKALSILSESGSPSDTIIQAADGSRDVLSIWANEVSVKGFSIKGADSASGIHFFGVAGCSIESNVLSNNSCGIDLYMFSSGNSLVNNDISDCLTGISLGDSLNNTLRNNSISYCSSGVSLFDSPKNTLKNNTVSENKEGISLIGESNSNTLTSNTIKSNEEVGLHLYGTSGNLVYNNYFNNTKNIESALVAGENIWNITKSEGINIAGGSYLGGNVWGKPDGTVYPRGARDIDLDGIFDSAYDIEGSGFIDYLPLKESESVVITVSNNADLAADFSSIQTAVDSAYPGDTVLVYPGLYEENVEINLEDLAVVSASGSPSDTRVQGVLNSEDVFYVTADGVGIRGFGIEGNISSLNSGIHLYGVEDCRIENNELFNSRGILQNSSGNSAQGNTSNSNPGFGIRLDFSGNNTLGNNTVSDSNVCILLRNSSKNTLLDNMVSNGNYGIWIDSSLGNLLDSNTASNNKIGVYLKASSKNTVSRSKAFANSESGINLWDSSENELSNNTASNSSNVCIILHNSSGNMLGNNAVFNSSYGIWLDSASNNNTLNENRASYNRLGIYLKASNENLLDNNTASNNSQYGIGLWNSAVNKLKNNTASYNYVSILLHNASENVLSSNAASDSSYGFWLDSVSNENTLNGSRVRKNKIGIYLKASGENILEGNSVNSNSKFGVCLSASSNNTFNSNTVDSNSEYGICMLSSNSNTVYNNYLNNTKNVYLDGKCSGNVWNISKSSGTNIVGNSFLGGNFWASPKENGFSQTHPDTNGDGICDAIYDLGKGNTDYLPLAGSV